MSNSLIKTNKDNVIFKLKSMMGSDEKIKTVTVRTTLKTDKAEHTVWEIFKRDFSIATFQNSKKNK